MSGPDLQPIVEGLHPHERALLRALQRAPGSRLAEEGNLFFSFQGKLEEQQVRSALERLKAKGIAEAETVPEIEVSLGDAGQSKARDGVAEYRIRQYLREFPGQTPAQTREALGLPQEKWGEAFGNLKKLDLVETLPEGGLRWKGGPAEADLQAYAQALRKVKEAGGLLPIEDLSPEERKEVEKRSRKGRGSARADFKISERHRRSWRLTEMGFSAASLAEQTEVYGTGEEIVQLSSARLKDGSWRGKRFRPYDLSVPPGRIVFGRAHPYRAFLDWTRAKLVALGFEEMTGDLVESEFWNADALYMPQFHPARAIHDVYGVASPDGSGARASVERIAEPCLSRVAATHETGGDTGSTGWRYPFDRDWTCKRVLRSQGTALSARWMARSDLKIPGKYFAIARCFRNDTVDATHAPDFFQVEGIVVDRGMNLRHLLGLLKLFATEIARAREVQYLPAYFPYTEPSVEVHIRHPHPQVGWMEMGGSGLFRPEVTLPLGLPEEVTVLAWGLGLDRMAMMALSIDDIRNLFSADLEFLRSRKTIFL